MHLSIRTALTLTFILLASLPILGVGFLSVEVLSSSLEKESADKNLLLAESYASELGRFISDAQRNLEVIVARLEDERFITPENLDDFLNLEVNRRGDLELLRIMDEAGVVTHLAPFDKNLYNVDMTRQEYFIAAKERQSPYWSNVFISPQTGESSLVLALPYKGGILTGHLSLASVREIIHSLDVGHKSSVVVLDANGTAIAHTEQEFVAQRSNLSAQAHIAEGLAGHGGSFRYTSAGQDQLGSVALIPETRWVVAVSQSLDQVFLPIKKLQNTLYIGALGSLLLAIFVAFFSLRKLLAPLQQIALDANEVAKGNFQLKPLSATFHEVQTLRTNFETMIGKVKTREQSLVESEQRFRATFEQAAVGIAHVLPEGRFLRINQKFCEIVGYSLEEMQSLSFQEITHPDDLDNDLKQVQSLLAGVNDSYSLEKRYSRKDSSIIWVNLTVNLLRNEDMTPRFFVAVIEDISKRKQAEEALRDSKENYRALMEQSPFSIQVMNPDGSVSEVNSSFIAYWGLSPVALKRFLSTYNILQDEEVRKMDIMPLIEKAFSGEAVTLPVIQYDTSLAADSLGFEVTVSDRWLLPRLFPVRNSKGEIVKVVLLEEDVTERKLAEQKISSHQKRQKTLAFQLALAEEQERRRIAADLHDDVGQTLAMTRLQLAAAIRNSRDKGLNEQLDEISQTLLKATQDTRHLIFELSSPTISELGIGAAVEEWVEINRKKVPGIVFEVINNLHGAEIDQDVLVILFRNVRELLTNTIKYSRADQVTVALETTGNDIRVTVKDNGVGFNPSQVLNHVNSEGGFGLFSVQERMVDLGGTLEIDSAPHRGCAMIMSIPRELK